MKKFIKNATIAVSCLSFITFGEFTNVSAYAQELIVVEQEKAFIDYENIISLNTSGFRYEYWYGGHQLSIHVPNSIVRTIHRNGRLYRGTLTRVTHPLLLQVPVRNYGPGWGANFVGNVFFTGVSQFSDTPVLD